MKGHNVPFWLTWRKIILESIATHETGWIGVAVEQVMSGASQTLWYRLEYVWLASTILAQAPPPSRIGAVVCDVGRLQQINKNPTKNAILGQLERFLLSTYDGIWSFVRGWWCAMTINLFIEERYCLEVGWNEDFPCDIWISLFRRHHTLGSKSDVFEALIFFFLLWDLQEVLEFCQRQPLRGKAWNAKCGAVRSPNMTYGSELAHDDIVQVAANANLGVRWNSLIKPLLSEL